MTGIKKYLSFFSCFTIAVGMNACNLSTTDGSRGPIVLGDPSTFVTEKDSQYLEDAIIDINDQSIEDELAKEVDTFNNVAKAAQLAKQIEQDSIAAVKAAQKEKEDQEKAAANKDKKEATTKQNAKKNNTREADKKTQQKTSAKSKVEDKKKKNQKR